MKSTLFITCVLSALLVSCQSEPDYASNYRLPSSSTTPQQQTHLALPGQAAVAVASETNDAFDREVQAYAGTTTSAGSSYTAQAPAQPATDPVVADALSTLPGTGSNTGTTAAPYGTSGYNTATPAATSTAVSGATPAPVTPAPADPSYNVPNATPAVPTVITQPQAGTAIQPAPVHPAVTTKSIVQQPIAQPFPQPEQSTLPSGPIDYSVKIINTTTGRLFVEAQDASGEIYPVGFLTSGTSSTINKTQAAPIKGPITVVIRDPDKPGTPEIRRYKVVLPAESYANKTLGISIVPGGIYHASLDGHVYYTSPGER